MSNRLEAYRFDGGTSRKAARRGWIGAALVGAICTLLAVAAVTIAQPRVDAPAILG